MKQICDHCGDSGKVYGERFGSSKMNMWLEAEDCGLCCGGYMMDYDDDFYVAYEKYLLQPSVREAHDWVFQIAMLNDAFQCVVDFGCGKANEFSTYARPWVYVGIDANAKPGNIKADYRDFDLESLSFLKPSAFVSLFSSEITAPTKDNYRFYESVFKKLPIKAGLVSGFFYANHKESVIDEPYGIKSHQTQESIDSVTSEVFSEKRIIMPVPSDLFGEDVYEVWKLFERKSR